MNVKKYEWKLRPEGVIPHLLCMLYGKCNQKKKKNEILVHFSLKFSIKLDLSSHLECEKVELHKC